MTVFHDPLDQAHKIDELPYISTEITLISSSLDEIVNLLEQQNALLADMIKIKR